MTGTIDLSQLPAPDAIEELAFEQLADGWKQELSGRNPAFNANIISDPAVTEMEVGAYREMGTRSRVNQGVRAVLLSHSTGADLDNLAGNVNLARQVIDPGDPDALPPVPPTYESNDALRLRVQLRWESITTAGSIESYEFHARSASGEVRDVYVTSPEPCEINIYVLSHTGTASAELLAAVENAVTATRVRPLGDRVRVIAAQLVPVTITAELEIGTGPDAQVVIDAAVKAVRELINPERPLGLVADLPSHYAALKRPGVGRINMTTPTEDIALAPHQAPHISAINITNGAGQ